jgi:2'-5' RNA ligase
MVALEALTTEERRAKSALILAVPEVVSVVTGYRRKYTADGATVPPHFTLLFPFLAPSEVTPDVAERIGDVAAAVACFDFTLSRVDRFPGSVMFLTPDLPEPFVDLIERFRKAFPEVSPYWDTLDQIVPHLTVADRALVDSPERLDDIRRALTPHLPIRCEAREVVLLQKVRASPAPWEVHGRFPLAPGPASISAGE